MRGGKGARSADQSAWPGGRLGISQFRLSFDVRNPGAVAQNAGSGKVYQLGSASLTGARGGSVTTLYDDAGNLTRMDLTRTGSCVPTSSCNQRFAYQWDEVGRLVRARRWNATPGASITDPLPGTAAADLRYVYNAADQRVQKEAVDASNNKVYTAYLFDSLELRRARYGSSYNVGSSGSDYELTLSTVVPFLIANGVRVARLVYEQPGRVPEKTPGTGATQTNVAVAQLHVILELSDHLGSTSLSIDRATSEVTSRSSYQAYGATESDYRPTRWNSFREDYKFTGKEEDAEVGLTYFGKRYLNAYLGRWISADPLAIHAPGEADLNVYAYVRGSVLKNVDPLGLEEVAKVATPITVPPPKTWAERGKAFAREVAPILRAKVAKALGLEESAVKSGTVVALTAQLMSESDGGQNIKNNNIGNKKATAKDEDFYHADTREDFATPKAQAAFMGDPKTCPGDTCSRAPEEGKPFQTKCAGKTDCTKFASYKTLDDGIQAFVDRVEKGAAALQDLVGKNDAAGLETTAKELAHTFKESTAILYHNSEGKVIHKGYYATDKESVIASSIGNVREGTEQALQDNPPQAAEGQKRGNSGGQKD